MEADLQRSAGAALLGDAVVAALQVRAGAERTAGAGNHQTAHLGPTLLDLVQRLAEPAQHIHGHGVHHLLMVEREDRDVAVEVERGVFELHGFLDC